MSYSCEPLSASGYVRLPPPGSIGAVPYLSRFDILKIIAK